MSRLFVNIERGQFISIISSLEDSTESRIEKIKNCKIIGYNFGELVAIEYI